MNKTEKTDAVSTLAANIGKATNAFLIDFKGITVPQVTELRRQIRDTKSEYVVVKNTLALIALKDSPLIELRDQFAGPTAVAFNATDAVALAKALTKFGKDVPSVRFKGAMLDGKIVAATEIDAIASLPSRAELVSKLLYVLQSPMRGIATVLQANIRNLAVVIDQIAKKQGGDAPASDAATSEASAGDATAAAATADVPAAEASAADAPATETATDPSTENA